MVRFGAESGGFWLNFKRKPKSNTQGSGLKRSSKIQPINRRFGSRGFMRIRLITAGAVVSASPWKLSFVRFGYHPHVVGPSDSRKGLERGSGGGYSRILGWGIIGPGGHPPLVSRGQHSGVFPISLCSLGYLQIKEWLSPRIAQKIIILNILVKDLIGLILLITNFWHLPNIALVSPYVILCVCLYV